MLALLTKKVNTMASNSKLVGQKQADPNRTQAKKDQEIADSLADLQVSIDKQGKVNQQVNKYGEIKMRGTGAATKGTKSRGPMA